MEGAQQLVLQLLLQNANRNRAQGGYGRQHVAQVEAISVDAGGGVHPQICEDFILDEGIDVESLQIAEVLNVESLQSSQLEEALLRQGLRK